MTEEELARAVEFCRRFHAASPWRDAPFDEDAMTALVVHLDASEAGYIELSEDGLILGTLHALPFSPQTQIGIELVWWSEKNGAGRTLREGWEAWLRDKRAPWVQASCLADANEPRVRALYHRAGYEAIEVAFRKRL